MSKDVFWFKHDYNARNDLKIAALLHDFKSAGYGIYWAIIENLHEDAAHQLPSKKFVCQAIAKQMNEDVEFIENVIKACISDYELLYEKDGFIYSKRVFLNMHERSEISAIRSESGKRGAKAKQKKAKAKQKQAEERRGEKRIYIEEFEKKEKQIEIIPEKPIEPDQKSPTEKIEISMSLELPPMVLEAAERNQYTHTKSSNTDFLKSQWKIFLSERITDPPEKKRQYRTIGDLTNYYINWVRNKFPKTQKENAPPGENGIPKRFRELKN